MESDTSYILLTPKHSMFNGTHKLTLTVKESSLIKDIYVTMRSTPPKEVSHIDDYAKSIGKGTRIYGEIGNITFPLMNFDSIRDILIDNEVVVLEGKAIEIYGHTYRETIEKLSTHLGIGGGVDAGKFALQGSISKDEYSEDVTTSDFEYYYGNVDKHMVDLALNLDDIMSYVGLLDVSFNNVMNNEGTSEYDKYPNDKKGIFALYENYGTHMITKGVFGGNYRYVHARIQNTYSSIVGADASYSAELNFSPFSKDWLSSFIGAVGPSCLTANVDNSSSFYNKDYFTATKGLTSTKATGGDAIMDYDAWDKTIVADAPKKWVLVSYKLKSDIDSSNSGLIPLSELSAEGSDRRKALEYYLDEYLGEKCPLSDIKPSSLVLVDFMMKTGKNGHVKGDPEPFVANDDWGIKRIYYPMMANQKAPKNHGYALDTSQNAYVEASDSLDHYWYYAMANRNEGYGVLDITFSNSNSVSEFTRRGNHADEGITGALDNNYVWLKLSNKEEDQNNFITAVGIYRPKHDDDIIASTGGAEWARPFENNKNYFDNFWECAFKASSSCWFSGAGLIHMDLKPIFSLTNIDKEFMGQGGHDVVVCHPLKWGE